MADLQRVPLTELVQVVGKAHGQALVELAHARDDRPVEPEREAKSISVEDTFETDLSDPVRLREIVERDALQVAARLRTAGLFARTVTLKVRQHDFVTQTRARTLVGATDRGELIAEIARALLAGVDVSGGVRLLGVGVAGLTDVLQEDLFGAVPAEAEEVAAAAAADPRGDVPGEDGQAADEPRRQPAFVPGADVVHARHGAGWVWGAGAGRVTVRFETRDSGPGPVRTFRLADPELRLLAG